MYKFFRLSENLLLIEHLALTFKCSKYFCTANKSTHEQQKETETPTETILVEKDDNITLIGINRPKQRNAINKECAEKLTAALSNFEHDDTSPIAVLYGIGGNFCAGYDTQELEHQVEQSSMDFLMRHEGAVGPTRRHLRKPVICSINGYCVASGLELALACDMRVMEEKAILGFANRCFGVPLHDGGTIRLAAMIGYGRALELLHTGRPITAKEALRLGLINRLVATGTALGQSVNLAFSIAKFSQAAVQQDRNNLHTNAYKRHGFRTSIQTEIMNMSKEVLKEMARGVQRYKQGKEGERKIDTWLIREKPIPDWERSEIDLENKHKTSKKV